MIVVELFMRRVDEKVLINLMFYPIGKSGITFPYFLFIIFLIQDSVSVWIFKFERYRYLCISLCKLFLIENLYPRYKTIGHNVSQANDSMYSIYSPFLVMMSISVTHLLFCNFYPIHRSPCIKNIP